MSLLVLLQGSWNIVGRNVQVFSEVVDTFVGQEPVVVSPCEGFSNKSLAGESLHQLNDFEICDIRDVWMSWGLEVLSGDDDTL